MWVSRFSIPLDFGREEVVLRIDAHLGSRAAESLDSFSLREERSDGLSPLCGRQAWGGGGT